jgi:phosphoadenosine phosphosulfate reductase
MDLEKINTELRSKHPSEIIRWALSIAKKPIVTTNFSPFEATILHAVSGQKKDIPVIWCDSGYNTHATYLHAKRTIEQLDLNIDLFVPQQTVAYRNVQLGIPEIDTQEHDEFTQQVKLEPFSRAMEKHTPDVWFTNLRKDQTIFRSELDIVTEGNGIIKIAPFFYWTSEELNGYLKEFKLESEDKYYDPTKALSNRECGLHTK